jgi:hypothetical protein
MFSYSDGSAESISESIEDEVLWAKSGMQDGVKSAAQYSRGSECN